MRVKYYYFSITPARKIVVTARQFKTAKASRSKKYKQIIINLPFSSVKQIAVRQEIKKKPSKHSKTSQHSLRPQLILPVLLVVMGLTGSVYFGLQTQRVKKLEPAKTFAVKSVPIKAMPIVPKVLPRSEPTHITVSSVGIDTKVIAVGRDASGGIEMPPLFDWTTGWYNLSPTPGQLGPAIIVGHVDTYKGVSVFWKLREVQPGDMVEIARADGSVARFRVEALKQFDQNNFPTQEVYGNIDHAGLRLITCGGAFDHSSGSYTQNTVVYASLVI